MVHAGVTPSLCVRARVCVWSTRDSVTPSPSRRGLSHAAPASWPAPAVHSVVTVAQSPAPPGASRVSPQPGPQVARPLSVCQSAGGTSPVSLSVRRWHVPCQPVTSPLSPSVRRWHVPCQSVTSPVSPSVRRWHVPCQSVTPLSFHQSAGGTSHDARCRAAAL